jgi:uncharacterized membrane protein (UPF0127 family)
VGVAPDRVEGRTGLLAPGPRIFQIDNVSRGVTLAARVRRADTSAARRKGLLGLSSLAAGEGLWIYPCEAVHTFGMRFPIDLVFLSKSLTVVKVVSGLRRNRLAGSLRARSVIELAAGTTATLIHVGDRLAVLERSSPVA